MVPPLHWIFSPNPDKQLRLDETRFHKKNKSTRDCEYLLMFQFIAKKETIRSRFPKTFYFGSIFRHTTQKLGWRSRKYENIHGYLKGPINTTSRWEQCQMMKKFLRIWGSTDQGLSPFNYALAENSSNTLAINFVTFDNQVFNRSKLIQFSRFWACLQHFPTLLEKLTTCKWFNLSS